MPGTLSRFRIEGLHNRYTIDVPIEDNKLILIGENGAGKSTVANFIYFFLTHQWRRMLGYKFKSVLAVIDSKTIQFTEEELSKSRDADRYVRRVSPGTRARLLEIIATHSIEELLNDSRELSRYAAGLGMPMAALISYLEQLSEEPPSLPKKLEEPRESLRKSFTDRVLYLPTYRRIEQDLASISPELASSPEFRVSMERWRHRPQSPGYIELVQFGMQDVEETIKHKMNELKDSWRDDLNKLTGTYLRDVIQGAYLSAKPAEIGELDELVINAIFDRIDPSVLPEPEQERLREIVAKIKTDRYVQEDDKVVMHFLTRLIELHKKQQEKEKDAREFVDVCNQYLTGKEFVYDNMNFEISIRQSNGAHQEKKDNDLKMSMLSSGEKQIVSLFSQIYLSGSSNYFVIIDEPELSLSIYWQKRFLPDILKSGRCRGLIAVTHSPFICDNELDKYLHALEQFVEQ